MFCQATWSTFKFFYLRFHSEVSLYSQTIAGDSKRNISSLCDTSDTTLASFSQQSQKMYTGFYFTKIKGRLSSCCHVFLTLRLSSTWIRYLRWGIIARNSVFMCIRNVIYRYVKQSDIIIKTGLICEIRNKFPFAINWKSTH